MLKKLKIFKKSKRIFNKIEKQNIQNLKQEIILKALES